MKFVKEYTSNYDEYEIIEINTLRELIELMLKEQNCIILKSNDSDKYEDILFGIEIYDDYRE